MDAAALEAFDSETTIGGTEGLAAAVEQSDTAKPDAPGHRRVTLMWLAVVVTTAVAVGGAVWKFDHRSAARPGWVTFESSPAGAEVFVGGVSKGRTPLTLALSAGAYDVRIRAGEQTREMNVDVRAGSSLVQHLELMPAALPVPAATGALEIHTDPTRLNITVDGVVKGSSPLRLDSLAAGEHEVAVRADRGTIRRTVSIAAGQTTSLVLSGSGEPAAAQPGWLRVSSPLPMQLREGGHVIGTTEADRMMLPSGTHELEIIEPSLDYRAIRKVAVTAGKTTTLTLDLPNGNLNLNALPWAEVWIDGERVGETPLANVSRPIGRHEVVFRHPQFGEHREIVVLTEGARLRLGVDLRKK